MKEEKIIELKNLFRSIEMFDEADEVVELVNDKEFLPDEVKYFQRLRFDAEQAINTTEGDKKLKYIHKKETLTKILEIIYLYA